ncbi:fibronectin type III domain-containing protein [Kandleria sp.]|uniref:fibronectin type III domain-containing protein n=1 Tax=Kandleria sp. TaxID=2774291 RepID=UPI001B7ABC47|nr:fibronectin type III domain-containing protein [Kandleria sp.]MBP3275635.1 fibronectin type III domain-containing protein [Kandleria sp.]
MKMNKKLSAALALSMVVGATTTVPVMAETTNNPEKTTNDTTKSATDLRNDANAAKKEYEEAAAASKTADQELETAKKDAENAEKAYNAAKNAADLFIVWQNKKVDLYQAAKATEDAERNANQVDHDRLMSYKDAKQQLEYSNDFLEHNYDNIATIEKNENFTTTYARYLQLKNDNEKKYQRFRTFCHDFNLNEDANENDVDEEYRETFVSYKKASEKAKEAFAKAETQFNENRTQNENYDYAITNVEILQFDIAQIESYIDNLVNTNAVVKTYAEVLKAEKKANKEEDDAHEAYLEAKKVYGKSFNSQNKWNREVGKAKNALNKANDVLADKKTAATKAKDDAVTLKAVYDKAEQKAVAAEKAEEALRLAEEARKAAKAKPAKVTLKKVKSKKRKTVKVTWKKAKNAKKYQVAYRRKKSAKKWTKWVYKVVKGKSYTNKKLKSKKTYQFKVRGLNGKIKGAFSKKKKVRVK